MNILVDCDCNVGQKLDSPCLMPDTRRAEANIDDMGRSTTFVGSRQHGANCCTQLKPHGDNILASSLLGIQLLVTSFWLHQPHTRRFKCVCHRHWRGVTTQKSIKQSQHVWYKPCPHQHKKQITFETSPLHCADSFFKFLAYSYRLLFRDCEN